MDPITFFVILIPIVWILGCIMTVEIAIRDGWYFRIRLD